MEGHILSSVFDNHKLEAVTFPALALLVSGGHTELVLIPKWNLYNKIGQTRDDAVGEAFDKVARLIGLPYPGGPEIGRLAAAARTNNLPNFAVLPRPMQHSGDFDFSFSGLKTAVRYAVEGKELSDNDKCAIARDFEDAAVDVLIYKTAKAIEEFSIQSLILGGGVSANAYLRHAASSLSSPQKFPNLKVFLPDVTLSTDNSIMIALAGHARIKEALSPDEFTENIKADGNRSLNSLNG
jgi:N6-L-threonylcarbamoyladenine synthase